MSLPARIGRYQVVGRLATGGMAEVLLGKVVGPSGFQRPVVIKRILPTLATKPSFVKMFLDEARVVACLQHPNVVHVHELGDQGGELFLVMEYLEGESVMSVMRRSLRQDRPLGRALAAYIVMQACAGLHAAHELVDDSGKPLNVVHRDVSPSNVFVTYSGGVKVIDFGVAKFRERNTETEAGEMKGKFAYMSPEQCVAADVDRRSDIFSLGILLYELTTSRRLFARETGLLSARAITDERIASPSEIVPDEFPPGLERIILKALSRHPAQRYQTAAQMRTALAGALREMHAPALMEDALAARMAELFPQRIREKGELVRRVEAGSEVTNLPDADVDLSVLVPDVDRGTPMGLLASDPPRRRPSALVYAAVGLFAAALGVGVTVWAAGRTEEPTAVLEVANRSREPEPLVEEEPPAPTELARSSHVRLAISSSPPGATVTVDGERRGVTPIALQVRRADLVSVVALTLDGYLTHTTEIVPASDQEVRAELTAERRRSRRARSRRGAGRSRRRGAGRSRRRQSDDPVANPSEPRPARGSPFRRFN